MHTLSIPYIHILDAYPFQQFEANRVIQNQRMDDLIPEESETIQKALKRLPPKEAYDRVFRIRRAFQVCIYILNNE